MKSKLTKNFLMLLLVAVVLAPGALAQIQIHVAPPPFGNDTTGTGSAGQPYATVGRAVTALNAAAAGSDILVAPGVYTENAMHIITLSGAPANPVEIKGNGGTAYLNQQFIVLRSVSNVVVDRLNMDARKVHAGCICATAVLDCTVTNVVATGSTSVVNDPEAVALGLRNRLQQGECSNFNIGGGCQRLYFGSCSVPDATDSSWFLVSDGPIQNASVTLENCYFHEQDTGAKNGATAVSSGVAAFRSWGAVDGLVFKNSTLDAWQYAYFLDLRFGQNQSTGLINRVIIENSTFIARGLARAMYISDAGSGSNNCVVRNSRFSCSASPAVQFTALTSPPTPSLFDNWQFYNCSFKDNLPRGPLDPLATSGNGTVLCDTVNLRASHFGFHSCYFEGGLGVRINSLPSPTGPFDSWVFENCTGRISGQTFFVQGSPPLTNWLIRDCSFTALRNAAGAYKGQLQNSLIQDCTFTTPNSARAQNADNGVFALGGATGGSGPFLVCQNLTFRRCLLRSGRSDLPGFNFDHGTQSIGLRVEDCEIEAPQLAVTATVGTSQKDLLFSSCTIRATAPGGRLVNLAFSGARNQTFQNCAFNGAGVAEGILLGGAVLTPEDTGTTLSGCAISNVSGTAIQLAASAGGVAIQGCTISNMTGNSSGIALVADSLTADTTNAVIRDNLIQDVLGYAVSVEGSSHTLRGNTLLRASLGGIRVRENPNLALLFISRPNKNIILERNCVYGNTSPVLGSTGIKMENASAPTSNLRIVNNTVLLWQNGIVLGGANVRGVKLFNNILYGNTGTGLMAAGSGNTYSFNGYRSNGTNASGISLPGNGDVLADPTFLSIVPSNPNFLRLAPGSPMIDMGSLDGTNPHLGAPGGDEIDIGCIESGMSAVATWRLM